MLLVREEPPNPQSVSEKRRQNQNSSAPPGTARMAARGNPSGDSIAEPSTTDLRAMIEERDVGSMEEDPATLENGMNVHLPTTRPQLPHHHPRERIGGLLPLKFPKLVD